MASIEGPIPSLPESTTNILQDLLKLHQLSIKSCLVLSKTTQQASNSEDLDEFHTDTDGHGSSTYPIPDTRVKLIGGSNITSSYVENLIPFIKPILSSNINYTNLKFHSDNLFLIFKNNFVFVFVVDP